MKFTSVTLTFTGQETLNEVYMLHMRELEDSIMFLEDVNLLHEAHVKLSNLQAIVYNKQVLAHGGKLLRAEV